MLLKQEMLAEKMKKRTIPFVILLKNHRDTKVAKSFPKDGKVFMSDIQNVICSILLPQKYTKHSSWVSIFHPTKIQHVVLVTWDCMTQEDVACALSKGLSSTSFNFDKPINVHSPFSYNYSPEQELFLIPFSVLSKTFWNAMASYETLNFNPPKRTRTKKSKCAQQIGISRSTDTSHNHLTPSNRRVKEPEPNPNRPERFSRLLLLMSVEQMRTENYPLPNDSRYPDFVHSFSVYKPVTSRSPMFGVDCEMVLTTLRVLELARITVVDEQFNVIYDELITPPNKVINYLTRYSGITKEMLAPVTKTIKDMQNDLKNLLPPDSIFVGHSLNSDLIAMKMFHPYVIDTSTIFNMAAHRRRKCALRTLVKHFLGRSIQTSDTLGHCSSEDSIATLELLKLKLSKDITFGDAVASGCMDAYEVEYEDNDEEPPRKREKLDLTNAENEYEIDDEKLRNHVELLNQCYYPMGTHLLDVLTQCEIKASLITSNQILASDSRSWHWVEELGSVEVFEPVVDCKGAISTAMDCVNDGSKFCFLRLAKCDNIALQKQVNTISTQLPLNSLTLLLFPGNPAEPHKDGICYVDLKV